MRLDDLVGEPATPEISAPAARRTVVITGKGSERHLSPSPRAIARERGHAGLNPDRIAMWAVLLGVVLLLVAATS